MSFGRIVSNLAGMGLVVLETRSERASRVSHSRPSEVVELCEVGSDWRSTQIRGRNTALHHWHYKKLNADGEVDDLRRADTHRREHHGFLPPMTMARREPSQLYVGPSSMGVVLVDVG